MRPTATSPLNPWPATIKAGIAYFAIAYGVGFALGIVRAVGLAPAIGSDLAVYIELPIMLTICWLASHWLIGRFNIIHQLNHRFLMGGLAFALLMVGEFAVSHFVMDRTFANHLASYQQLPAMAGLVAQIIFGLIPAGQLAIKR